MIMKIIISIDEILYTYDSNSIKIENYSDNDIISNDLKLIKEDENCLIYNLDECINCNPGYYLINKTCIKYSFKAIYKSESDNENITLINNLPTDIIEMIVDGEIANPSKYYLFPFKGNHTIHILLNITNCTSLREMFSFINKMISITFTSYFNTENIEDMSFMFMACTSLTSINISIFNTQKLKVIEAMFDCCFSMISVDFSNLNLENVEIMYKLFYLCTSLTYINFSNVKTFNLTDNVGMLHECISLTSIDLSSLYTNKPINPLNMFFHNINLSYIDISSFKCASSLNYNIYTDLPDYGI